MGEHPDLPIVSRARALQCMDWSEIHEAGCYLHLSSGLLARVFEEEPTENRGRFAHSGVGAVVRLTENPHTSIIMLREVAMAHGLKISS